MKRNKHSLSHYTLSSFSQGELIPIGLYEVLPGDTVQQATSALLRASPLVAPVMHPVHARIHHWFVPNRLIWEDWEAFITGGPDGMDASTLPMKTITNPAVGSLADYLGVPTGTYTAEVSALPFRAYALIFNEWYRDQDLVTELTVDLTSGPDTTTNTTLQSVAWEKDYFTSARPWEQKGPAVTIGLGSSAPVTIPRATQIYNAASGGTLMSNFQEGAGGTLSGSNISLPGGTVQAWLNIPNGTADLTSATAVSINDLREAFALQRYEEARARYGSRYTEYLRYLGVRSSDARLQRPEYLGGGKQTIQFSEVLQTAEGTNPVGMLRGHGVGAMRSNRYRRFFEEHGWVITLMSVKPRTMYMQQTPRHWLRNTKEDFWQKELEHIGQQEIQNREVYAPHGNPTQVFGYQDRYDEYRRMESRVSGEFRDTLKYWHMARDFSSAPALNGTFVTANPTNRVYASTTTDQIYCMAMHSIQARRMVAKVGTSYIF